MKGKGKCVPKGFGCDGKGFDARGGFFSSTPFRYASYAERGNALMEAIHKSLEPVAHLDPAWSLDKMEERVHNYFYKATGKYMKDERVSNRGSPLQAQAIVEEFVDCVMGAVSAGCYDKEWFLAADFSVPLYQAAKGTFCGGMLFRRTLAPTMKRYVDEALFRFREEERFSRCMYEVLGAAGLTDETYKKKASKHMATAFEEAHTNSPYGTMVAASPEVAMLQEFIRGWMTDFVSRSWDVLENGVSSDPKAQILFVATIFQHLVGPDMRCLPQEFAHILSEDMLPPVGWPVIVQLTEAIFKELDDQSAASGQAAKRRDRKSVV